MHFSFSFTHYWFIDSFATPLKVQLNHFSDFHACILSPRLDEGVASRRRGVFEITLIDDLNNDARTTKQWGQTTKTFNWAMLIILLWWKVVQVEQRAVECRPSTATTKSEHRSREKGKIKWISCLSCSSSKFKVFGDLFWWFVVVPTIYKFYSFSTMAKGKR